MRYAAWIGIVGLALLACDRYLDEEPPEERAPLHELRERSHGDAEEQRPAEPQRIGHIRATVHQVKRPEGLVTLDTGSGTVTLHARPVDLGDVAPGDVLRAEYATYGGQRWILPSAAGTEQMPTLGALGTMIGEIEALDRTGGTLQLREETYHLHPQQVESFVEGQLVQLQYVDVEGDRWIIGLRPANAPAVGM